MKRPKPMRLGQNDVRIPVTFPQIEKLTEVLTEVEKLGVIAGALIAGKRVIIQRRGAT